MTDSTLQDKLTDRCLCCGTHDLIIQSTYRRPANTYALDGENCLIGSARGFHDLRSVEDDAICPSESE
jgi:hypothetical protein